MAKKRRSSLRARRAEQLAQQKKKRRMYYLFAGIGAVAIIALFAVIRQANAPSLEDVKLPESIEAPPDADGKNWGPADAPVVIEEFSDFQ